MEIIAPSSERVLVQDSSQVGDARRRAVILAQSLGFNETDAGRVALIATEMATNIVKHAKHGQVILRSLVHEETQGIELLALDQGEGSYSTHDWLRDGYSTAGSAGQGLGAISRLSTYFDLQSLPGLGSVILSHVWAGIFSPPIPNSLGAICVPIEGEQECGDLWSAISHPGGKRLLVVDGLGHGPYAAEAARAAAEAFHRNKNLSVSLTMEKVHVALRPTRGAAVAIADLNFERSNLEFVGVGNISAFLFQNGERHGMVSSSGIAGHDIRRLQVFTHAFVPGAGLILHTDGLTSRWDLHSGPYASVLTRNPAILAGVLFRDFCRGRDDATVVVVRLPKRDGVGGLHG